MRDLTYINFPKIWGERKKAGLCPACGKTKEEFEKHRKVYCSEKCSNKYLDHYKRWGWVRDEFLEKHGEFCDKCGINKTKNEKEIKKKSKEFINNLLKEHKKEIEGEKLRRIAIEEDRFMEELKKIENPDFTDYEWRSFLEGISGKEFPKEILYLTFEVDHKIAIVNGGDAWDKKNFQVLCRQCHKEKTKKDMLERKAKGISKLKKFEKK